MLAFLLETSIKGSLLFLAIWLIASRLRHASPAARHLIWMLGFVGSTVLAVGHVLLPRWGLPLLPAPAAEHPGPPMPLPIEAAPDMGSVLAKGELLWYADPNLIVFLVWSGGIAFLLGRFALSWVQVRLLHRQSQKAQSPDWLRLAIRLENEFDLADPPRIRIVPRTITPMTLGAMRPIILLPQEAEGWSEERRRLVLIHEIAHIKRGDYLMLLLTQAVCAVYWFNPLVWLASRHLVRAREEASDALVVAAGNRASTYAAHLLDIARHLSGRSASLVSVCMARPSELEGRLVALLRGSGETRVLPRGSSAWASLLCLLLCLPLSGFTPWRHPSDLGEHAERIPGKLRLMTAEDKVCMMIDELVNPTMQTYFVDLGASRYRVATKRCALALEYHPELRLATDPLTGKRIDKAEAVIAVYPFDSKVAYFESEANLNLFNQGK